MTGLTFWFIQLPGWLLFFYLAIAQCTAAINYQLGVRMGTQEPAEQITEVGVAIFRGLAFADLVFYTPLLGLGLIGHMLGSGWTFPAIGAALGITAYWPIVSLATVKAARGKPGWNLPKERQYWIVLPIIALWGFLGLVLLGLSA
ncbi:MAG: hypothetical protein GY742_14025 [Hyphomicrobiales bacterium]|nr:hypothetical protein [Hyphomicrobiales bacterium]